MHKRVALLLVAVAGALALGALYYRSTHATPETTVVTATVTRGSVVEDVEATGTVEAVTTVQVGTQVSGTIESLHADFNSAVRRGQVVAKLDPSLFQTQVDQAQATLTRLQAELERNRVDVADTQRKLRRAQELFAKELISRSDLEAAEASALHAEAASRSAEAQITQARASLNQAEVNLAHTVITAPIDGVVISRNVDVGQTVAASMQAPTLFVIARDLTRMQVRASVNEADVGRIQPGQPVSFRVDAYPEETFSGSVTQVRLQPIVEQNVVSYTTVIDVPNPNMQLKPGMTASVTVEIARSDDVLRVPNAALRFRPSPELIAALGPADRQPDDRSEVPVATSGSGRGNGKERAGGARVWVLREGRLVPLHVRPGISDGTMTAVLRSELAEGDRIVTGVTTASAAATQTTSPLLPFGGRGRPGGTRQAAPSSPRGPR